jgi:Xaa-Pro dipeptidase
MEKTTMLRRALLTAFMTLLSALPLQAAKQTLAEPVTREEMLQEIDQKMGRVQQYLKDNGLGGLLVTQVRNFSWITGGIADNHIVITSETGAASLLIMRDGRKYVIATNSEIPRLTAEDLKGLGYEAREFKWFEGRTLDIVKEIAAGQTIATDSPIEGLRTVDITPLRLQLTPTEIKKYRWLGKESTAAVIATINQIKPGMSERQIEAVISNELMRREIRPTVLLIGTDERLYNFRHATPSDALLKKYGMVNICARRWGLVVAVTRFVHFGPIPAELSKRLQAAANVNANFYAQTRPGMKAGDILEMAKKWYAENGFDGEWQKHHQGGAIGYGERDWVATPGSQNQVNADQAFAWNPTVMGAKIEDTIIAHQDGYENITETAGWPTVTSTVAGKTYKAPAILVRSAGAKKKTQ